MPETALITLSDIAARKAKFLLEKSGHPDAAIRVRVVSGGCSGLEYRIDPDTNPPQPTDLVVTDKGITVYLDPKGLLYMAGSELDYVSSLMDSGFKFKNPNAVAECGCGQSFTA